MRTFERTYLYPLDVVVGPDVIIITCPDIPEMVACGGDDLAASVHAADDVLVSVLSGYVEGGRAIPVPSPAVGRPIARLPTQMVAKLLLHDVMLIDGVSDQRLAALLGVDRDTVRHLRAPMHSSTVGAIGEAFRAIGLRLVIAAHSVAATEDTAD